MNYYMTVKSDSRSRANWEKCKSLTLIGAKKEATRGLGGGYHDDVLHVGVPLDYDELYYETISTKSNFRGAQWIDWIFTKYRR